MERIYKLIKLNKIIGNHRLKFAGVLVAHQLKMRHLFLRFDPVMACNLRCTMCYFSDEQYRRDAKGVFKKEDVERIAKLLFPRTLQVVFGCGTEPTLYRDYAELVRLAKSYGIPYVGMTSNGQLLTKESLTKLIEYGLDELALSVHGVQKKTYERFMVNSSFEKFNDVLAWLETLKKSSGKRMPHLRLNYTVNAQNLDELEEFFGVFGRYTIKTLQVRPVMDIGGQYRSTLQAGEIEKYDACVKNLSAQCKERGVVFMANTADPGYQSTNYNSLILEAVKRYISPDVVWRRDFNWREESYELFCKRIGWSKFLLRSIFSTKENLAKHNTSFSGKYAARYEVSF